MQHSVPNPPKKGRFYWQLVEKCNIIHEKCNIPREKPNILADSCSLSAKNVTFYPFIKKKHNIYLFVSISPNPFQAGVSRFKCVFSKKNNATSCIKIQHPSWLNSGKLGMKLCTCF